jgi:hypothetical protein
MANRGSANDQRAIGDSIGDRFKLFRVGQHIRRSYGGARALKRHIVRIHYP